MPTFDQLPAEQQAIIELVVRRGRSYDALSDALGIPPTRVRELAREALTDLAPLTAERVDPDRRAQIADYVLGQQASAEDTATRAHLRRSEAARAWTLSLLDSLADMYEDGTRPDAPAAAAVEEAPRERGRPRERVREREERPRRGVREPEPKPREEISPEAQAAVRRRRLIAGGLGLIAVAGLIVGIVALTSGGGSKKSKPLATRSTKLIGEQLRPLAGARAQGLAVIAQRGTQRIVVVQAKLPPTGRGQAYEVWLYNSPTDAQSIGAQVTDKQGNYQGQGPLPANVSHFKFIDVSLENIPDAACQKNPACLRKTAQHNGHSVLRGTLAAMRPINANAAGAGGANPGTGTTNPGGGTTTPGTGTPTPGTGNTGP